MQFERQFRLLDHPWHIGAQAEQVKFPFAKFSWLRTWRRGYSEKIRGDIMAKHGVEWVTEYEPGKYDAAILHLDQQCFEAGIWDRGKGTIYRELNEVITDIPKIVLMHGTPYYPESYPDPEVLKAKLRAVLGDNFMVVNSHKAKEQWGIERSRAIIHGMHPEEWWDLPKEPRVVTMVSPGGLPMYYDRTFLQHVKEALEEHGISHCHISVDWQSESWDDYRNFLGRSLIYFNPTRESPMPRSRTEAMLSGCCVITTPTQDADTFIEDGVNGFLCKRNPDDVVKKVLHLMQNYDEAIRIGQAGKETAKRIFHHDRYAQEWYQMLCDVVDRKV